MKFSIITPTYRRADMLSRSIESVLQQTYSDWEMIIINDSPQEDSYIKLEDSLSDQRIIYLKNAQNKGANYSRNRGLETISQQSEWIIFLDDDDYLTPDALETLSRLIQTHADNRWFVTNRAYVQGSPLTNFPASNTPYSYVRDYLMLKRCKGDATHCIQTKLINRIKFSQQVAQGEEWFFFYQIGLKEKIFYHNHNTTLTEGYNASAGLNFRKRPRSTEFKILLKLFAEGFRLGIAQHPTFLLYLSMRFIRLVFK